MQCVRCGVTKSPEDFYTKDRTCKQCRRLLVAKHRSENIERLRAYDRERAKTPERKQHNREVAKTWRDGHTRERSAQVAVGNAVRDGRLFKWPVCAMPECEHRRVVGHHPDYDHPLQVVWLCQAHHKQAHTISDQD